MFEGLARRTKAHPRCLWRRALVGADARLVGLATCAGAPPLPQEVLTGGGCFLALCHCPIYLSVTLRAGRKMLALVKLAVKLASGISLDSYNQYTKMYPRSLELIIQTI